MLIKIMRLKKLHEMKKKYVNNGLSNATDTTRLISFIIMTSMVISFAIFSYFYSGVIEKKLGTSDEDKTFTISKALAYGNKPGFFIFMSISFFYLTYLLILRGPKKLFIPRIMLLFISFSFLISLLWFTTMYNENLHYSLAGVIFTFILFFNLATFYLFYKRYRSDRNLFILMSIINIGAYVSLIVFAILHGSLSSDVFAALEIVFALLFLVTVGFLGFY